MATWRNGGRIKCHACGTFYTWRSGTLLCGWSADARQIVLLLALIDAKCQAAFISTATGIPASTVRDYRRKLAEACQ